MINICPKCDRMIDEGQDILMQVIGTYHLIKDINCFALGKDLESVPGSMEHLNCREGD